MAALSKWVPIGDATNQTDTTAVYPIKLTTIDKIGGIYCHICHVTFGNKKEYDTHYTRHGLGDTEIIYTCVVCRKEIPGYPSFRGHCYLKHVTKDKFKCDYCEKVFSKLSVLNTHIKVVHHFKCATCDAEFQNQKELSIHQIVHKNDEGPPYKCRTCGQKIDSTDDCEQHIEDHCHMTYPCPICDEPIDDLTNMGSHLTKHFGDVLSDDPADEDPEEFEVKNDSSIDLLGGIFCCHCDEIFKARPDFDNHFTLEHPDKPIVYACNICTKEFEKYFLFANHCYDHYAKGRFQCDECYKCFPRLSLLVGHVEAAHGAGAAACEACARAFRSARRLRDHRREAHGRSDHPCLAPGCNQTFATPKQLRAHAVSHASCQRCRTCGLRLGTRAACERHVRVHRKALYRCPVCARAYHEKYLVMKHIPRHFCSVLHICNICGKVYNARGRLNDHMKTHNEEKNHKCTYCGKGFTKNYLLNQHLNIHTGLRPYSCTVCSKAFASQPNLIKHMKCMHNVTKIDMKLCYNANKNTKKPNSRPNNKIQKIDIVNTPELQVAKEEIPFNNNTSIELEAFNNLPSLETSPEVYDTPGFDDSDENSWKTDEIDPGVLEMLERNIGDIDAIAMQGAEDITELENALWVPSPTMPTGSPTPTAAVPREYGPEFVTAGAAGAPAAVCISLDDHLLPHIDPRLALAPPAPHKEPLGAWEPPLYTKLTDDQAFMSDVRYDVFDTDIF